MNNNFNEFKSKEDLIESFSEEIVNKLENSINEKGSASILVSGGNTPKPLFEKLSTKDIDWTKVKIGLVDERWVDENHQDSNAKLVKDFFLKNKASKAVFIPLHQNNLEVNKAEASCSSLVEKEFFPCDVLILGMGEDFHTASLFPNNDKLKKALDLENKSFCVSMTPKTAPHDRMSLTLSAILKAQNIYLHIQGLGKKQVYDKAINENDFMLSPLSAVLKNKQKNIEVYYNE